MRLGPTMAHGADVAEVAAAVGFDGQYLRLVLGSDECEPIPPEPPAVGQRVGYGDIQDAGPFPVSPPPAR